ncbi:hypothetical protein AVEN_138387-1 [Araneus ventricosus]|uniref:Uncharacterized protein n=1 Tax=Araneus ventricosus TaxID=182803 RepID=A0A4Y2SM58_ARAVE|nr:hypothetical protein AVEN_138387-1 [Araneus ventricosus]
MLYNQAVAVPRLTTRLSRSSRSHVLQPVHHHGPSSLLEPSPTVPRIPILQPVRCGPASESHVLQQAVAVLRSQVLQPGHRSPRLRRPQQAIAVPRISRLTTVRHGPSDAYNQAITSPQIRSHSSTLRSLRSHVPQPGRRGPPNLSFATRPSRSLRIPPASYSQAVAVLRIPRFLQPNCPAVLRSHVLQPGIAVLQSRLTTSTSRSLVFTTRPSAVHRIPRLLGTLPYGPSRRSRSSQPGRRGPSESQVLQPGHRGPSESHVLQPVHRTVLQNPTSYNQAI